MPGLFSLGQYPALLEIQAQLRDDERLFAYLDDLYILCSPERARDIYDLLQAALWTHARIQLNYGKTRMWNAAGSVPVNCADLGTAAELSWIGDHSLPYYKQGLQILDTPIGHLEYIRVQLELKRLSMRVVYRFGIDVLGHSDIKASGH